MSRIHRHGLLAAGALSALLAWAPIGAKTPLSGAESTSKVPQGALLPRDSNDAATFRGGLVYSNYCITCHGINADGNGRAARLYKPKPANLRTSEKPGAYFGLIIRKGGAALGRSEFMPSWEAELTDEQVNDLVSYLRSINTYKN